MEWSVETVVIAILGGLVVLQHISTWIVNIDKAREVVHKRNPNTEINERLDKHEELLERDHKHLIEHDKDIKKLNGDFTDLLADVKENNRVTVELLFMLIDNITGEIDTEGMKEAKAKLHDHCLK